MSALSEKLEKQELVDKIMDLWREQIEEEIASWIEENGYDDGCVIDQYPNPSRIAESIRTRRYMKCE